MNKSYKKFLTLNLLMFLIFFININVSNASFNPLLANKLQRTLDSLVTMFTNTKGMCASVYVPKQGTWEGASGLSHNGTPINNNMELGIASVSKLYTSVVLLKLAEDNVLKLDDSLKKWLPTYKNISPNITLRQLLNHTSGISDPFTTAGLLDTVQKYPTKVYTPDEVLSYQGLPTFQPGVNFAYSNINYILAGMVAQKATNKHISKLIREIILTPLNLDSTFYDIEEIIPLIIAHRWKDGIDINDVSRVSLNTSGGPAGAMFTNTSELAQFYFNLFEGNILNETSLKKLTTFVTSRNYGLGIEKTTFFNNECWGHSGGTIGYKSRVIYDPCKKTVVTGLTNSTPSAVDGITALLYKVIVDYLPNCAGVISGQKNMCKNQKNVEFSVPNISNATSYIWTLPEGAIGSSTTNTIKVDFGSDAKSGVISVRGYNIYGEGMASEIMITINNDYDLVENANICSGGSYLWNNKFYNSAGTYKENLKTVFGCDSNITLNLSVNSNYKFFDSVYLCSGSDYNWRGKQLNFKKSDKFTESLIYDSLKTLNNCDSIYHLRAFIYPIFESLEELSLCDGNSINWRGLELNSKGSYTKNYKSIFGCDSIYTLSLEINNKYNSNESKSICKNETIQWHNKVINKAGIYSDSLKTYIGCDSVFTLNVEVLNIKPIVTIQNNELITDDGAEKYQWIDCSNNKEILNEISKNFKPKLSGKYAVIIKKDNCTDTSDCQDIIINSINDENENMNFIFPNPTENYIKLMNYIGNYEIFNIYGETILRGIYNYNEIIDISELINGTYFVKTNNYYYKFIKVK